MTRLTLIAFLTTCACAPAPTLHGIPRLELVDPGRNVWRSAQPATGAEWKTIAALGVKRDVVLREPGEWPSDPDDALAEWQGIEVVRVPMPPGGALEFFDAPREADVTRAVSTAELGDALVHCLHGEDRTGFVVARYRVEAMGWSLGAAWNEALDRGLHWELLGLNGTAQDWLSSTPLGAP